MGLSRNKVAVSEGAAGSPPFYGERATDLKDAVVKRLRLTRDENSNGLLFNFQGVRLLERKVGVTNAEGPPVPIPNTEVKLCSGENTLREAAREDSSMPTQRREQRDLLSALKAKCEKTPH